MKITQIFHYNQEEVQNNANDIETLNEMGNTFEYRWVSFNAYLFPNEHKQEKPKMYRKIHIKNNIFHFYQTEARKSAMEIKSDNQMGNNSTENLKQKRFKKIAYIQSHHLHLQ